MSDFETKNEMLHNSRRVIGALSIGTYGLLRGENYLMVSKECGEMMVCNPETEAKLIAKLDEFWKENF